MATPICSIATAVDGGVTGAPGVPVRHDSVPQPRTPEDVEAQLRRPAEDGPTTDSSTTDGTATAARLREAFTDRLRAARAEGRSLAELAAACRRPVEEVRALLGEAEEEAGGDSAAATDTAAGAATGSAFGRAEPGFVRFQQAAAPSEGNRPASAPRSAREELRSLGSRRPSPSRRLRRMHPQADRTGQEAAARETAATDPTGTRPHGAGWEGTPTGTTGAVADYPAAMPPVLDVNSADWVGTGGGIGVGVGTAVEASRAEPPLGILIGGSPVQPEAVGRPEERTPVRVAAEPIRVGRGTSLVVLPSWRPAIAVSVSTEQLIAETGLAVEQLAAARLTVRMNPWALHDRELDLHGWELGPAGPSGRAGRRGGRG